MINLQICIFLNTLYFLLGLSDLLTFLLCGGPVCIYSSISIQDVSGSPPSFCVSFFVLFYLKARFSSLFAFIDSFNETSLARHAYATYAIFTRLSSPKSGQTQYGSGDTYSIGMGSAYCALMDASKLRSMLTTLGYSFL